METDKFQYMKASLAGEAASIIAGLLLSGKNYQSALNILKNRYGSTARVITAHVRCLLYTSPSPRDGLLSRMPSSA